MLKNYKTILNIDSRKLTLLRGKRGVNNSYVVNFLASKNYDGYADGEFLNLESLEDDVKKVLVQSSLNNKNLIKELSIGFPAEFAFVTSNETVKHFKTKVKITDELLQDIAESAIEQNFEDKILISCKPIWVKLDDERLLYSWKNKKSSKISALFSYVYVDKKFVEIFNEILSKIGVSSVEYVCIEDAESRYLLAEKDLTRKSVILDIGYISSSVSLACGNGIYDLKAFSYGGAHISADLSECLNITFEQGEALKQEIVLSINSKKQEDYYEVDVKNKIMPVPIDFANEIACARLDMMCTIIKKCISSFGIDNSQYVQVYLTGEGISYIKGARDYIAKSLGRNVELLFPYAPAYSKPHFSSAISVLDYVLNKINNW